MSLTRRSFVKKSTYSAAAVTILGAGRALASEDYYGWLVEGTPTGPITNTALEYDPPGTFFNDGYTSTLTTVSDPSGGKGETVTITADIAVTDDGNSVGNTTALVLTGSVDNVGNFTGSFPANTIQVKLDEWPASDGVHIYRTWAVLDLSLEVATDKSLTASGVHHIYTRKYIWGPNPNGPGGEYIAVDDSQTVHATEDVSLSVVASYQFT